MHYMSREVNSSPVSITYKWMNYDGGSGNDERDLRNWRFDVAICIKPRSLLRGCSPLVFWGSFVLTKRRKRLELDDADGSWLPFCWNLQAISQNTQRKTWKISMLSLSLIQLKWVKVCDHNLADRLNPLDSVLTRNVMQCSVSTTQKVTWKKLTKSAKSILAVLLRLLTSAATWSITLVSLTWSSTDAVRACNFSQAAEPSAKVANPLIISFSNLWSTRVKRVEKVRIVTTTANGKKKNMQLMNGGDAVHLATRWRTSPRVFWS